MANHDCGCELEFIGTTDQEWKYQCMSCFDIITTPTKFEQKGKINDECPKDSPGSVSTDR